MSNDKQLECVIYIYSRKKSKTEKKDEVIDLGTY